jgi:hypothetical protein
MTRCAGSQGTGFACMLGGMQEPLDAARSVCAVVQRIVRWRPPAGDHPAALGRLRRRGFELIGVDLTELLKAGGSVKCCTLGVIHCLCDLLFPTERGTRSG